MYRSLNELLGLGSDDTSRLIPRPEAPPDARVVEYLRNGHVYAVSGRDYDLLDPARPCIGGLDARTDGVWAWTSTIVYLVERYNIELPAEFLGHVERNEWRVPRVELSVQRPRRARQAKR